MEVTGWTFGVPRDMVSTNEPNACGGGAAVGQELDRCEAVSLPWYVVQTQPRREHIAERSLQSVCTQVFCPRFRQRAILHGYRREVARPLFPSYLFAAFDRAHAFRAVHYAHGVRKVVELGGEPAVLPPALLDDIRSRMCDGFVVLEPAPLFTGQRVEIIAGPLQGFTGIFQSEVSGAGRVAILLDSLQYNARAILDRAALRAVG